MFKGRVNPVSGSRMSFASGFGATLGRLISLVSTLVLWLGVGLVLRPHPRVPRRLAAVLAVAGGLLLAVTVGYYGVSLGPAVWLSIFIGLGVVAVTVWRRHQGQTEVTPPPVPE